jgi:wyosine [tRNA(Phe)-imidazoG37] synthetase (radical SAM superfamily)
MALHDGIIYGPIRSRRFGTSLGVNLLPAGHKVCSFNCVYCQYSWTEPLRDTSHLPWPSPSEVTDATAAALSSVTIAGGLDRITLAGHGEPTLHPAFGEVVAALRATRDALAPGVPLAILSNSTTAHLPEIRQALIELDERNMKLDVGRQEDLRRVNASRAPLSQIVEALAALPGTAIQAMFVRDALGRIDNTLPGAIDAWLAALERIRPRVVQIYTLARGPALPTLGAVPAVELEGIARRVRNLGIAAQVIA